MFVWVLLMFVYALFDVCVCRFYLMFVYVLFDVCVCFVWCLCMFYLMFVYVLFDVCVCFIWCLCVFCLMFVYVCFVWCLCRNWFVHLTRQRVSVWLWEECWNTHLITAQFDRSEVTLCDWLHVKTQLLTNPISVPSNPHQHPPPPPHFCPISSVPGFRCSSRLCARPCTVHFLYFLYNTTYMPHPKALCSSRNVRRRHTTQSPWITWKLLRLGPFISRLCQRFWTMDGRKQTQTK